MKLRRVSTIWFYTDNDFLEFFEMFGETVALLETYTLELDNLTIKVAIVGDRREE